MGVIFKAVRRCGEGNSSQDGLDEIIFTGEVNAAAYKGGVPVPQRESQAVPLECDRIHRQWHDQLAIVLPPQCTGPVVRKQTRAGGVAVRNQEGVRISVAEALQSLQCELG